MGHGLAVSLHHPIEAQKAHLLPRRKAAHGVHHLVYDGDRPLTPRRLFLRA
jgi:hypothetical protein